MNNKNLAKLFLILSIFFGTLLIFIVPSFQSPDEDSHFIYSYEISKGRIFPTIKDNKAVHGIPKAIFEEINEMSKIHSVRDNKYDYSQMYFDQLLSKDYSNKIYTSFSGQSSRSVISFLAPALGVAVANCLDAFSDNGNVSVSVLLQFARFFSLIIYSIIGYLAIKITPKFKKTFFVILLMPMSMFLRSMVTYDSLLLVLTTLVLAIILNLIYNDECKFNKKYLIFFIITGFLLFYVKTIYSIVFFAFFAVPSDKFKSKKDKIKNTLIIIISVLILYSLNRFMYSYLPSSGNENFSKQLKFVMSHPYNYMKILLMNIYNQMRYQDYWMLGTLGWLDTYMPVLFVFILKIYIIITIIIDAFTEKAKVPLWLKIGYFILIVLAIFAMYTIMYLSWTPTATGVLYGNSITGIQGRYFIPFLVMLPVIFSNNLIYNIKNVKINRILNNIKRIFDENFHYVTITLLCVMTIIMFMRYYC